MHIEFDDGAVWVADRTSVFFRAKVDGKNVKCFVSIVMKPISAF